MATVEPIEVEFNLGRCPACNDQIRGDLTVQVQPERPNGLPTNAIYKLRTKITRVKLKHECEPESELPAFDEDD